MIPHPKDGPEEANQWTGGATDRAWGKKKTRTNGKLIELECNVMQWYVIGWDAIKRA